MLSVLIDANKLRAAEASGVRRLFYSSFACVYAVGRQSETDAAPFRECDAYPAFAERLCRHFQEDGRLETRVGRYHNVYGPFGAYDGGREKAPAAICRKVAQAKLSGTAQIEIWGDGKATRSFLYVDHCLDATTLLMASTVAEPLNIGSAEPLTIDELVGLVECIAGICLKRTYRTDAPQGVRGRSSDNTLIRERLDWQPSIRFAEGMARTYAWIEDRIAASRAA